VQIVEADGACLPDIVPHVLEGMRDPDPAVVIAAINTLLFIVEKQRRKDLIPSDTLHLLINLQRLVCLKGS
jgi:hypothetical protein